VGVGQGLAETLVDEVRGRYRDPSRYLVFRDAVSALKRLQEAGWRNVIVSNHVPELPRVVEQFAIAPLIDRVFSSAGTGYEKPHPGAFRAALEQLGVPSHVYMVGDNPVADLGGAAQVGVPGILVRPNAHDRSPEAITLLDAADTILNESGQAPQRLIR
jgi:putative hydrolase of the HAD superfamily